MAINESEGGEPFKNKLKIIWQDFEILVIL